MECGKVKESENKKMRQSEEMLQLKKNHKQAVVKNTQAIILQTNAHVRHYPLDNFNLALKLTLADSILVTTMLSEKLKGKAIS